MDHRDQARHGLKALEPMLQLVLDTLPVRVFWKDRSSVYLGCNHPFALDAGLSHPSEIIGRNDYELAWREQAELYRGDDRQVIESGIPKLGYEEPQTGPDGRRLWLRTSKIPLRDAAGEIIGVLGTYEDITERKAIEEALRQTIRVVENSPAVVFRWTRDDRPRIELVSQNVVQFGYTPDDLLTGAVRFEEVIHPEDMVRVRDEIHAYMADGRDRYQLNYRIRTRDGRERWSDAYILVEREANGRVRAFQGISIDSTERMRAEHALLDSEQKYRQLVNNSLLGFYITQSHVLKFCNQRFATMFGYDRPEDLIGKHVRELVDPECWDLVDARVQERESGRTTISEYEFRCVRRDGSTFDVEVLGSRIEYEGHPAIQGSMIDISARKQMEALRARLEEQLVQAQKMESVGRLAGGIAHDLNNLLSPIVGYADLLEQELPTGDPRREYVGQITTVADRAKELIQQLLAFSRKQVLELQPVDMRHVLRAFETILRRTIREDIRIELDLPPELGLVRADVGQIEQVLMNMAVNAQDAMPDGGVLSFALEEETVEAEPCHPDQLQAGHWVVLTVRDSGTGMDPDIREHLFEPFFTTKEVGKGTGLGLSTVYGIVAQHGGTITVESQPARGSVFRIYLPRTEAAGPETTPSLREDSAEVGTETILLVEDNDVVRQVTSRMLERKGYRVIATDDPFHAIALLEDRRESVDLLLTDVIMPGMNGRELFEKLRTTHPSLKALFMSGYDPNVVSDHGILNDDAPFIQKPFNMNTLADKVRAALSRDRSSS